MYKLDVVVQEISGKPYTYMAVLGSSQPKLMPKSDPATFINNTMIRQYDECESGITPPALHKLHNKVTIRGGEELS